LLPQDEQNDQEPVTITSNPAEIEIQYLPDTCPNVTVKLIFWVYKLNITLNDMA
jgi:hypothetical protein